jgi:uncharacterized protein YecT (DUF1311 family)
VKVKRTLLPWGFTAAILCLTVCGCISPSFERSDCVVHPGDHTPTIKTKWGDDYWNVIDGQQVLNIRASEWAAMTEAELYLVYCELITNLDRDHQTALAAEQARWLKVRARKAKADADQFEGGTMWSMEHGVFMGDWNSKRLQTLSNRLAELKKQTASAKVDANWLLPKLEWHPSILFMTSDEEFWAREIVGGDKARTWHHWAEFQDMKLQVAYAFLHLNLSPTEWQPLAKAAAAWTDEKNSLAAKQADNADAQDRELGRAAARHFSELEKQFAPLRAATQIP